MIETRTSTLSGRALVKADVAIGSRMLNFNPQPFEAKLTCQSYPRHDAPTVDFEVPKPAQKFNFYLPSEGRL